MAVRVLVVDDAAFMRMMVKDILTKNGYEVVGEAENGMKALEKYQELKPDLTTMDITMPEMDGISAVKEIKKADHKYKDGKCIWCGKKKPGYDNVPSTGDITSVVTMGVVAMISVVAAAAYVTKRRITK